MIRLLYVDADKDSHLSLKVSLKNRIQVIPCHEGQKLTFLLNSEKPNLIILQFSMPKFQDLLHKSLTHYCNPSIIITSKNFSVEEVVFLMRLGVDDCIIFPCAVKEMVSRVEQVLWRGTPASISSSFSFSNIPFLGTSDCINSLRETIKLYSKTNAPILITGESGTGKELVARKIHALFPGIRTPFVARNCGAFSPSVIESELFGTIKGAYTDAINRPGCFELANRGTLFLDEITSISPNDQAKLLRILEEGCVTRMGATLSIPIDIRIITATNEELIHLIKKDHFRRDLFYRISTLQIEIPPLRARKEDISTLAQFYIDLYSPTQQKSFSKEALDKLLFHSWPGNIRELVNVMRRALALSGSADILTEKHILLDSSLVLQHSLRQ